MCPVCGTPLGLATESPQAQRERELIRRLVARCRSKDEVKAVLKREYGDAVLAIPSDKGFDLAAYLVPALAILLAGGAVAASALRWRRSRRTEPQPAAGPPVTARASERLETDLERYEL
jgi:cytochrome c-type biogenesis protein CcmH/NrfF